MQGLVQVMALRRGRPQQAQTIFDLLDRRARRAVLLARAEARLLRHNYIDPEHIMLGLLREPDCIAVCILRDCAIQPEAIRRGILEILEGGTHQPTIDISFTRRAEALLVASLCESWHREDDHIGTAHMLLGIINYSETVSHRLADLGADPDTLRHATTRRLETAKRDQDGLE